MTSSSICGIHGSVSSMPGAGSSLKVIIELTRAARLGLSCSAALARVVGL